jgi:hypothetical protein
MSESVLLRFTKLKRDAELLAAKVIVDQQYTRDFVNACGYFSQQVARVPCLWCRQAKSHKRGNYTIDRQEAVEAGDEAAMEAAREDAMAAEAMAAEEVDEAATDTDFRRMATKVKLHGIP